MQYKNDNSDIFPSYVDCWNRLESRHIHLSQKQFAKLVGISQSYVSKYKAKNIFLPDWAYIISRKYDISMEWILTGTYYTPDEEKSDLDYFLEELRLWLLTFENDRDKIKWFMAKFSEEFPEYREFAFKLLEERLNVDHLRE